MKASETAKSLGTTVAKMAAAWGCSVSNLRNTHKTNSQKFKIIALGTRTEERQEQENGVCIAELIIDETKPHNKNYKIPDIIFHIKKNVKPFDVIADDEQIAVYRFYDGSSIIFKHYDNSWDIIDII